MNAILHWRINRVNLRREKKIYICELNIKGFCIFLLSISSFIFFSLSFMHIHRMYICIYILLLVFVILYDESIVFILQFSSKSCISFFVLCARIRRVSIHIYYSCSSSPIIYKGIYSIVLYTVCVRCTQLSFRR